MKQSFLFNLALASALSFSLFQKGHATEEVSMDQLETQDEFGLCGATRAVIEWMRENTEDVYSPQLDQVSFMLNDSFETELMWQLERPEIVSERDWNNYVAISDSPAPSKCLSLDDRPTEFLMFEENKGFSFQGKATYAILASRMTGDGKNGVFRLFVNNSVDKVILQMVIVANKERDGWKVKPRSVGASFYK